MKQIQILIFEKNNFILSSLAEEIEEIKSFSVKTIIKTKNGKKIILDKLLDFKSVPLKKLYPLPSYLEKNLKTKTIRGVIVLDKMIIPILSLKKYSKEFKNEIV